MKLMFVDPCIIITILTVKTQQDATVLSKFFIIPYINPLKPELNPICYLLALLGAHHFLHISRIRVKLLTFRLLMSYIYIYIYIYICVCVCVCVCDISRLRVKVGGQTFRPPYSRWIPNVDLHRTGVWVNSRGSLDVQTEISAWYCER